MEEYLEDLLTPLLSKPAQLVIKKSTDELGVLLTVRVASEDMGVIIGVKGTNIQGIRTVMHIFGVRSKSRINVKVLEPIK